MKARRTYLLFTGDRAFYFKNENVFMWQFLRYSYQAIKTHNDHMNGCYSLLVF